MSARPLAKPLTPLWWSDLTDSDKTALLQAFKFRTGVNLTMRGESPAAIWQVYENDQVAWRARRREMAR